MSSKRQDALKGAGNGDMRPLLSAALPHGRPDKASRQQTEDVTERMTLHLLKELTERRPNQHDPDPDEQQEETGNDGSINQEAFHVGRFKGLVAVAVDHAIEKDSERNDCEEMRRMDLEAVGSSPGLDHGAAQTWTEKIMLEFRHHRATIFVVDQPLQMNQRQTDQNDDEEAGGHKGRDAAGEIESAARCQKIVRIISGFNEKREVDE